MDLIFFLILKIPNLRPGIVCIFLILGGRGGGSLTSGFQASQGYGETLSSLKKGRKENNQSVGYFSVRVLDFLFLYTNEVLLILYNSCCTYL